jgi:hypothetical protein
MKTKFVEEKTKKSLAVKDGIIPVVKWDKVTINEINYSVISWRFDIDMELYYVYLEV